jgi:dTDP-4-dehydrorhamnose 3,5-epimerase
MKILEVNNLPLQGLKTIKFARYFDNRGYFTEIMRDSSFFTHPELSDLADVKFTQANESFAKKNVIKGLHFQWGPHMSKLVRTVSGHMVDMALDIRKNSPTYGKIILYDMPSKQDIEYGEWIWLPAGFAHGNFFLEDTTIQYFCTGQYSPSTEAGICPLTEDLDWSLADKKLVDEFKKIANSQYLISDKDKNSLSLTQWTSDQRSKNFIL